jgi:DNA-binding CsgD family transcriptional regulator/PAS domain-containing protein
MMAELADLSALIGDIYDAALDSSSWPAVLKKVCDYLGGYCAYMFVQDNFIKASNIVYSWTENPAFHDSYLTKYARINPAFPTMLLFKVGEVIASNDVVPDPQLQKTRFYKEWLAPQGYVDCVGMVLEKSPASCAVFVVFRDQRGGRIDETARERMALLVPHIRRAVLIGKTLDQKSVSAADLADTLDAVAAAIYLVNADGRMVHANRSGAALLAQDDLLCAVGGRLLPHNPTVARILSEALAAANLDGDLNLGAKGTAVPLTARHGEHYVAHVLPLNSGTRRRTGDAHAASAALFVHKATLNVSSQPEVIAKAYGLTPSELTVLFTMTDAPGVRDIAKILGLSQATIKTHLHNLYGKTGTKRQSELMKLIAAFSSPLA